MQIALNQPDVVHSPTEFDRFKNRKSIQTNDSQWHTPVQFNVRYCIFFSCSDFPSTYHIHAESLRFILLRIDYVFVLFCTYNTKARVTLNFFPRRFTVAQLKMLKSLSKIRKHFTFFLEPLSFYFYVIFFFSTASQLVRLVENKTGNFVRILFRCVTWHDYHFQTNSLKKKVHTICTFFLSRPLMLKSNYEKSQLSVKKTLKKTPSFSIQTAQHKNSREKTFLEDY